MKNTCFIQPNQCDGQDWWVFLSCIFRGNAKVLVEPNKHEKQYPHMQPFKTENDVYELEGLRYNYRIHYWTEILFKLNEQLNWFSFQEKETSNGLVKCRCTKSSDVTRAWRRIFKERTGEESSWRHTGRSDRAAEWWDGSGTDTSETEGGIRRCGEEAIVQVTPVLTKLMLAFIRSITRDMMHLFVLKVHRVVCGSWWSDIWRCRTRSRLTNLQSHSSDNNVHGSVHAQYEKHRASCTPS